MSAQEKLPLSKNSVAQWIHVVIILFFMFGFKYVCPPFSTITEVGVGVLVFSLALYMVGQHVAFFGPVSLG